MKKTFLLIVLCFLLVSCGRSEGSFQEGTRNMEKLYDNFSERIEDGKWRMASLEESFWGTQRIENKYQLDKSFSKKAYIKSSVIEVQLSEIAFFKINKQEETIIKQAIKHRIQDLKSEWGNVVFQADNYFNTLRCGRIGQYYYMILGEDSKKVVNYIQELK